MVDRLNGLFDGRSSLREIAARRVPGEPRRRWFMSAHCDLVVWLRDDDHAIGFQFCYGKDEQEHALTWSEDLGFSHARVDSGVSGEFCTGTPLLVADGAPDAARILGVFERECEAVPAAYVSLVVERLIFLRDAMATRESGSQLGE